MRKDILKRIVFIIFCITIGLSFWICSGSKTDSNVSGAHMTIKDVDSWGMTLVCAGESDTGDLFTGSKFWIEERTLLGWNEVSNIHGYNMEIDWTMERWIISEEKPVEWNLDWGTLYGELEPGKYRICKEIYGLAGMQESEFQICYAEFTIE